MAKPAYSASCLLWQSTTFLTCLLASISRLTAFRSLTSNMSLSLRAWRRCSSERGPNCRNHQASLSVQLAALCNQQAGNKQENTDGVMAGQNMQLTSAPLMVPVASS